MDYSSKYLYGIIPFSENNPVTIPAADSDGTEISAIPYRDIACVVSDYKGGFGTGDRKALVRSIQNHQAIMESLIKDREIIPIKFGTKLDGRTAIENMLESGYFEFHRILALIKGKIELDVTAFWNSLDAVLKEIAEWNEEICSIKSAITGKPYEDTISDRVKIGAIIKSALDKRRDGIQNKIFECMRREAVDAHAQDVTDDRVIFSGAFLIEREKEPKFDEILDGLNEDFRGAVNFRCVFPLPPYSFSTIDIKEVGYDEILKAKEMLSLGDEATAGDIRESYRNKTLGTHPDKDPGNPMLGVIFEELTNSYRLLNKFCNGERCSFRQNDFKRFFYIDTLGAK
ncbi:MAG: GvpL/GvpF family gas vesicle protein [Deltaproteobacteria bacterium]|nr:GvpL/GvpF family gas vesicle protein [Deltaproteobacteria bacterium]